MNDTTLRVSDIEEKAIPKMVVEYHKLVQELAEKLTPQEIHDRKLNLLICGAKQVRDENAYTVAATIFSGLLGIQLEESTQIPLVNAHRLPAPRHHKPDDETPNPLIVRFARMRDRERILHTLRNPAQDNPMGPREQATPTSKRAKSPSERTSHRC